MDKVGYGIYTIMDINLLPPLHLIYAENPSDSGKVRELFTTLLLILIYDLPSEHCLCLMQVHSSVRRRWLDGDEFIISSMAEIAKLAEEGRTALLKKDYAKLKELMNRNFDLRR